MTRSYLSDFIVNHTLHVQWKNPNLNGNSVSWGNKRLESAPIRSIDGTVSMTCTNSVNLMGGTVSQSHTRSSIREDETPLMLRLPIMEVSSLSLYPRGSRLDLRNTRINARLFGSGSWNKGDANTLLSYYSAHEYERRQPIDRILQLAYA